MFGEQEAQHRMQHDIRLNWAIRKKNLVKFYAFT